MPHTPETTPSTAPDAVLLDGVSRVYAGASQASEVRALDNVSLRVPQGAFVSVMGPSGSGKSTLLHVLGGLDRATSGTVRLAGLDLAGMNDDALTAFRRERIGFVFQFFNLLTGLSALENVCLPAMFMRRRVPDHLVERAQTLLEEVGLGERIHHRPHEMSGGQQQRVAIARALLMQPSLVLADEPTGNLDTQAGAAVMALLERVCAEQGATLLMVTHDASLAARADRQVTMRDGQIMSDDRRTRTGPLSVVRA